MSSPKHTTSAALVAMATVVITAFVIAALYIGRDILIPIALATLLTFLLSPLVTRLEKWIGRVAGTLLTVTVVFAIIGGLGWALTHQVVDLATRLPDYQENIRTKLRSLRVPEGGRFSKLNKTLGELKKELPGMEDSEAKQPESSATSGTRTTQVLTEQHSATIVTPTRVEIVETKKVGTIERFGTILSALLGPLGTGALVLLLLVCMLLQRDNLRGRLIRLIGGGNISATTRGMDDAARRVSRYLFMQLVVNATYGVVIGIGLYFIGVPNSFVWGVLATVLRFIPYVGPWIAAAFPVLLSLAVTNTWTVPALTIGLFIIVELLSNNVMEPMVYGSSTGVSAIALIIAAVFWTYLWGAAGLVLATPLTVCLVVMGRHVPRLHVLAILLSDEEALAPHEEFYHRLLTPSATDAIEFADNFMRGKSRTDLYDAVMIPVLLTAERDRQSGYLDDEQHSGVLEELRDTIADIRDRFPSKSEDGPSQTSATPICRVVCLPARAERDELAGAMLSQLLAEHGFSAIDLSATMTTGELLEAVERESAEAVCISVLPPSTITHARYLCGKLRSRSSKMRITVGLWGATEEIEEATQRLRAAGADEVVSTVGNAVEGILKYAATLAQEAILLDPAFDETARLDELRQLNVLDTDPQPVLDRITAKLAHILNVPIALVTFIDAERQFLKSQVGLPDDLARTRQMPRDASPCSHVVARDECLVVEDLARDRRFASCEMVKERGLRFYAGAPLRTASNHVLGAICVLDTKPRRFGDHEKRLLQVMAEEVMETITLGAPAVCRQDIAFGNSPEVVRSIA